MEIADLHMHTTASDGQYTPAELINIVKKLGIGTISITDHDTVDGIIEAQALKDCPIKLISGIEFSAKEYNRLHILGYSFDLKNKDILRLCEKTREGRDKRKYEIISFLNRKGLDINIEEVEAMAGGKIIARPHFARVMINKQYVKTVSDAFDLYLDTEEFQKIQRFKPSAEECIATILRAGGVPVLAHPGLLDFGTVEMEKLLKELIDYGIMGIECVYPKHSLLQQGEYKKLAKKYNLFVTAGSDFHGEKIRPANIPGAYLQDLSFLIH